MRANASTGAEALLGYRVTNVRSTSVDCKLRGIGVRSLALLRGGRNSLNDFCREGRSVASNSNFCCGGRSVAC